MPSWESRAREVDLKSLTFDKGINQHTLHRQASASQDPLARLSLIETGFGLMPKFGTKTNTVDAYDFESTLSQEHAIHSTEKFSHALASPGGSVTSLSFSPPFRNTVGSHAWLCFHHGVSALFSVLGRYVVVVLGHWEWSQFFQCYSFTGQVLTDRLLSVIQSSRSRHTSPTRQTWMLVGRERKSTCM